MFDSFSGNAVWFGLLQIFKKVSGYDKVMDRVGLGGRVGSGEVAWVGVRVGLPLPNQCLPLPTHFPQLLFSALIALLGNSFVQSTFFTVFHFVEVIFLALYSPFNDRSKVPISLRFVKLNRVKFINE